MIFRRSLLLFSTIAATSADAAMTIDNYSSATNDRFQDSDSPDQFFLSNFPLSGVGQDSNSRWATLIGPNTIISANHFKPSGTISFYPDNDPTSAAVELGITSDTKRIGTSDLWLARLDDFAPSNLQIYDIETENISEPISPVGRAEFSFRDSEVFMTGRSPSTFPSTQNQAYGTNLAYDFHSDNVDGLGDVEAIRMNYDTNPSETTYESFFQSGDSGAPLFIDNGNNELLLLGINSFTNSDTNGDPVASFSSYVGNDSEEINATIAEYAAIPEPGVVHLIGLALVGLTVRRSRTA
jgi:hypothetical protein